LGFHYESKVEVWIEGEQEKMGFMKRRWDYEREDGIMKEKMGFMKEIEEGPEVGEWERLRRWMGREC